MTDSWQLVAFRWCLSQMTFPYPIWEGVSALHGERKGTEWDTIVRYVLLYSINNVQTFLCLVAGENTEREQDRALRSFIASLSLSVTCVLYRSVSRTR